MAVRSEKFFFNLIQFKEEEEIEKKKD